MSQAVTTRPLNELVKWPEGGYTRVPLNVFTDPGIYAWEQDLIFRGPAWSFLGLEVEIPAPGDYITNRIGDTPVIVVRKPDGAVNALVNRSSHGGPPTASSSGRCSVSRTTPQNRPRCA